MAINEIKDLLDHSLHHLASGYARPRGLLVPIDPWMRGTLRWARKFGGQGSVWRPDTLLWLTETSGKGEYAFYVDHIPDSMLLGTVLLVGPTEKLKVSDWDTTDLTLTTIDALEKRKDSGTSVSVWGWPATVEGGASAGANSLLVTSELYLGYGDRLEMPVGTDTDDWKYTIGQVPTKVSFLKETSEGYRYQLTLPSGLTRALASGEIVYFRAYPGYFSGKIPLPNYSAEYIKLIGPFLLDWLSGPLTTNTRGVEYFRVKQFRADRIPITPFIVGDHNAQVNRMPIQSGQMLMWRLIDGILNHQDNLTICTCDSSGHFRLVETLTPEMVVPAYYATGAIGAVAPTSLVDNDYFTVGDGNGHTVTFEFKVTGAFVATAGCTTIDVSSDTSASDVAASITSAINYSSLLIEANAYNAIVQLVHQIAGTSGNVTITESVASSSFYVSGLSGGGGGLSWVITVTASAAGTCYLRFHPNAEQTFSLTAGANVLTVTLNSSDSPAAQLDLRFSSTADATFKCTAWSLQGSRTAYVETETVVQVIGDQWACSCLFAKPLWPNLELIANAPDIDLTNSPALIL
jgi:hypothetical protein